MLCSAPARHGRGGGSGSMSASILGQNGSRLIQPRRLVPLAMSYNNNPYESYEMQPQMAFFQEVEEVKRDLVQYEDNIERIEALHKRSLGETDVEAQEFTTRQIDALATETNSLSSALKARIQQLVSKSSADSTKTSQAENLKRQFKDLIQKYQRVEAQFRQQYRNAAERQYRIVEPAATDAEIDQALDSGNQQVFSQALLQSNQRGQARAALHEVQNRHAELQKIEQTMAELAQLFHDMEIMVAEQDTQVQQIDDTAAQAQTNIQSGVAEQQRAIVKARKWRKKKWWCFGILVLIAIILIAVLCGVLIPRH